MQILFRIRDNLSNPSHPWFIHTRSMTVAMPMPPPILLPCSFLETGETLFDFVQDLLDFLPIAGAEVG